MAKRKREGILPFKIVPTNEPLVARSGLTLPYELAKALKLPKVIDRELPQPGSGRGYKPSQFIIPLILMLHGGGKKLEDLREIKSEMSLRELLEMESLPASCTIGDWLRRMGESNNGPYGLSKVNRHLVREVIRRDKRNSYTLDVDATVIEVEKREAQITYKGEKGYQPQIGFLFETGLVLEDEFREGNVPASANAVSFLEKCFDAMPYGKYVGYLRSDSAFYQARVINFCFEHNTFFTITVDQDKAVKEAIKAIKEDAWQPYQGDRQIAETIHTMNGTKEAFRLIVIRWPRLQSELLDPSPYFYHAIATNREEDAEGVIKLHNQRGETENYIKELKNGFGMEWMPCGESYANAIFFRIGVIAYNLFLAMKLLALPRWYRTFTISTMRWRLYQIAGAVVKHAHQLLLKLVAPLNKIVLFHKFRLRCCELAFG